MFLGILINTQKNKGARMKKIIGSFAALASAFVAQHADAKIQDKNVTPSVTPQDASTQANQSTSENVSVVASGNKYEFLLKKSERTGELHAYHSSHSSHSSHRSHSSSRY